MQSGCKNVSVCMYCVMPTDTWPINLDTYLWASHTMCTLNIPIARCFCSGKCRHNSIEYDFCGVKPCLSPPLLILTLTLTLNTNPKDITKPNPNHTDTLIDSPQTPVYHCHSHCRCYCGGMYRRKRFIHSNNLTNHTMLNIYHDFLFSTTIYYKLHKTLTLNNL